MLMGCMDRVSVWMGVGGLGGSEYVRVGIGVCVCLCLCVFYMCVCVCVWRMRVGGIFFFFFFLLFFFFFRLFVTLPSLLWSFRAHGNKQPCSSCLRNADRDCMGSQILAPNCKTLVPYLFSLEDTETGTVRKKYGKQPLLSSSTWCAWNLHRTATASLSLSGLIVQ